MNLKDRVEISPHVMTQGIAEELVLLDLQGEAYFGLDPVGTRMWNLLAEGACFKEVVDAMAEEYEVSEAQLESDLIDLVRRLKNEGIVSVVSTGESNK